MKTDIFSDRMNENTWMIFTGLDNSEREIGVEDKAMISA